MTMADLKNNFLSYLDLACVQMNPTAIPRNHSIKSNKKNIYNINNKNQVERRAFIQRSFVLLRKRDDHF